MDKQPVGSGKAGSSGAEDAWPFPALVSAFLLCTPEMGNAILLLHSHTPDAKHLG